MDLFGGEIADVKRDGATTSWTHKGHLASNRLVTIMGGTATPYDYGPFGRPQGANLNGKAYLNERYDAENQDRIKEAEQGGSVPAPAAP